MKTNNKILILNTGGTFNKYYEPLSGELKVVNNNNFVEDIMQKAKIKDIKIEGLLFKDSLEMENSHRETLKEAIHKSGFNKIIVIHGTDTMDKSAQTIATLKDIEKTVIFTGAMKPYSIEKVEAVANFMTAYGYLLSSNKTGVFISMHGMVQPYNKIYKNRSLGIFECQN